MQLTVAKSESIDNLLAVKDGTAGLYLHVRRFTAGTLNAREGQGLPSEYVSNNVIEMRRK